MNINKKIIIFLTLSSFLISVAFTFNSISTLKKSQTDNLKLFKEEFLELGRESFKNHDSLFFGSLDREIKIIGKTQTVTETILNFIKANDTMGSIVIFDIKSRQFLEAYNNPDFTAIATQVLMEKYIQENILNQKTDFDFDNFSEFSSDATQTVVPKKIHFHIYNDTGIIVGFGQDFSSGKIRIEFIERQNEILFNSQLYSSIIIFIVIFILAIILAIIFMRRIILIPLNKIVEVVKEIAAGDSTKRVVVKSKDEIGQLGLAFNEMTSKLIESSKILESKVEDRTKELQLERGSLEKKVAERTAELTGLKSNLEKTVEERTQNLNTKMLELERMNDLMLGRELKMLELKNEIKKLKSK